MHIIIHIRSSNFKKRLFKRFTHLSIRDILILVDLLVFVIVAK